MRIFLGVVCFLFSTIMGHVLSKKYTYRRMFYTDFSEFNKKLKREVAFTHNSILSIIQNYKENESIFYSRIYSFFKKNEQKLLEDKASREGLYLNEINELKKENNNYKGIIKGFIISIIILVLSLAVCGFYIFKTSISQKTQKQMIEY